MNFGDFVDDAKIYVISVQRGYIVHSSMVLFTG
jgi:hypothetical protein